MVEADRLPHRFLQPQLAFAIVGERRVVVAKRDASTRGKPFDRFDEVEMLELTNERDRVAALLATEAVSREDVVFEHEGVGLVDDRAIHLLDPIGGLDRLHDPAAAMNGLLTFGEPPTVFRQQEEFLDQVGPDEVHAVQVAPATVDADPALRRDAVGAHSQAGADVADERQVRTVGRVEHDGPVGGHDSRRSRSIRPATLRGTAETRRATADP